MSRRPVLLGSLALAIAALALSVPAAAALALSKAQNLGFGLAVAGASSGTVTMSPGGLRSTLGGVVVLTQGAGAAGSPARFDVSGGPANTQCDIGLPADGTVYVSGTGTSMGVNSFSSSPALKITLDGIGAGTIYIGGVLSVGASISQTGGVYTAPSFTVSVTCP